MSAVLGKTGNPQGKYLSRSSSEPGDRIAVTGWLGTSAAGLNMLKGKLQFDTATADCLKSAFARPQPRLAEGKLLVEKGVKTAIDISDGLLADLGHICKASGAGALIEVERLPIKQEVKSAFGVQAFTMALSGGEDYQLLFTAKPAVIEQVSQASEYPITVIGEMVAENPGEVIVIDQEHKRLLPQKTGWDHFNHRKLPL